MNPRLRLLLIVIATVQAVLSIAFTMQVPVVTGLWPFPGTTPLSFTFIASIFGAAAASTTWCVWINDPAPLAGIALDYIVILTPATIFSITVNSGETSTIPFAIASAIGVAFGVWLLTQSFTKPYLDTYPTPRPLLVAFVIFIVALIIAGGALVLGTPGIMPWQITPDLSVLFGAMFLGAAAYFAYALYKRYWANAGGQLAGFLVYDLFLIIPFFQRFGTVAENLRLSLYIYTAVVTVSALLAIYYLFVNGPTRILRPTR
ncbi:MAG: hypothetical protein IPM16_10195 [Chloroflexi bacterium]|nr:hypothetical protein [Chloroflexota bacterium]